MNCGGKKAKGKGYAKGGYVTPKGEKTPARPAARTAELGKYSPKPPKRKMFG